MLARPYNRCVKLIAHGMVINGLRYHGNFNLVCVFSTLVGPHDGTSKYELATVGCLSLTSLVYGLKNSSSSPSRLHIPHQKLHKVLQPIAQRFSSLRYYCHLRTHKSSAQTTAITASPSPSPLLTSLILLSEPQPLSLNAPSVKPPESFSSSNLLLFLTTLASITH